MINVITDVTKLTLDNNRIRYTAICRNPFQSVSYRMRLTCWVINENLNVQT
jgi:hypothetical protein